MEVPSGPWADLTLLLRQAVGQTGGETEGFLLIGLLGLVLFVSVCLLLCQMILYVWWQLGQVERELAVFPRATSAPTRPRDDMAPPRRRRSVGSNYTT